MGCPMTDIEENTWQEGFCHHCGILLRGEQRVFRPSDGFSKTYCSDYCHDQGLKAYLSRPIFEAPSICEITSCGLPSGKSIQHTF